jgi:hypothetical protein
MLDPEHRQLKALAKNMTEIKGNLKKTGSFPPGNGNITNTRTSGFVAITRIMNDVSSVLNFTPIPLMLKCIKCCHTIIT